MTKSLKPRQTLTNLEKAAGIGKDSIGRAIDVYTGTYCDPESLSSGRVLCVELKHLDPNTEFSITETSRFSGETHTSLRQEVAVACSLAGSYGFFSGGLTASHSMASETSSHRSFIRFEYRHEGYLQQLNANVKVAFSKNFCDQLLKTDPEWDVFCKNFGTHCLVQVVVGAAAYLDYSYQLVASTQKSEVEASIKASYGSIIGMKAEMTTKQTRTLSDAKSERKTSLIGGDTTIQIRNSKDFDRWFKSIESKLAIVSFPQDSLVALGDLLDRYPCISVPEGYDSERLKEQLQYYQKWIDDTYRTGFEYQVLPLYRAYNPKAKCHFYTTKEIDVQNAQAKGYSIEGIECPVFGCSGNGRERIHRLYNKKTGKHHYVVDTEMADETRKGYKATVEEDIFVLSRRRVGHLRGRALRRYHSSKTDDHFLTVEQIQPGDETDRVLVKQGWRLDMILGYAPMDILAGTSNDS